MSPSKICPDRDHGASWGKRLEEARHRIANRSPALSQEEIQALQHAVVTLDVTSPPDSALFWSSKDILTGVPLDEKQQGGPRWWDKLAPCQHRTSTPSSGPTLQRDS